MTWENHGDWHVDHIIPISIFKKGTPANIVNKLENLRPIWSNENLSKSNKIEDNHLYLLEYFKDYILLW
jgi:hypothetical protein